MLGKRMTAVLSGDLNMLRCFIGAGIPTILLSTDPNDITFASRHCRQKAVIASPAREPARSLEDLLTIGHRVGAPSVFFYGDDAMLLLLSRNRDQLAKHFRFRLPPRDRVECFVDKL